MSEEVRCFRCRGSGLTRDNEYLIYGHCHCKAGERQTAISKERAELIKQFFSGLERLSPALSSALLNTGRECSGCAQDRDTAILNSEFCKPKCPTKIKISAKENTWKVRLSSQE